MTHPRWNLTPYGQRAAHPGTTVDQLLGFIPSFLDDDDPAPAERQINNAYAHGGGWYPYDGFNIAVISNALVSRDFPEEPDLHPLAETRLRDERLYYYNYSWVAIVQPDGRYSVARLD